MRISIGLLIVMKTKLIKEKNQAQTYLNSEGTTSPKNKLSK